MIDEYCANGFNGRAAYKKFNPNAADQTADVNFSLILSKTNVSEYFMAKRKSVKEGLRSTHEALLSELERWVYSDLTEVIMLDPEAVKQLPLEIKRLITGFETKERILTDGTRIKTVKCTFVSKEKAMEMIHKHTGFYAEDNFQKNVELSAAERREILNKLEERRKRLEHRQIDELM